MAAVRGSGWLLVRQRPGLLRQYMRGSFVVENALEGDKRVIRPYKMSDIWRPTADKTYSRNWYDVAYRWRASGKRSTAVVGLESEH